MDEKPQPDRTIAQGRALVRAIEALDGIASTDPVAGTLAGQLTAAYQTQLQAITETASAPAAEVILKEKALVKSRRRCCVCHQFAGEDINVYHIDPDIPDLPTALKDAIVLCLRCHAEAVYARSQHLADTEFSARELRIYRDLWWEWCEQHPDLTIPTSLPGVHGEHIYMPLPLPEADVLPEPGPLPPGSRLPHPRNRLFTGRIKVLDVLAQTLLPQPSSSPTPLLITQNAPGIGGVGKTQLAVEFAYRYGRFFSGVHWLDGAQLKNLDAEVAACGEEMDLPHWPEKQQAEQVIRVLEEWHQGGTRLVILDNLEESDPHTVREWLYRISGGPIRLLITARHSDLPADIALNVLPLELFTPEESHGFLRQYLPQSRAADTDIEQLAEYLGYLPLALDLAGHYLSKHPYLSAANYLRLLKTAWDNFATTEWREQLGDLSDRILNQASAFALSWERASDEDTRRLFLLAGHCAPNRPIPHEILAKAAGLETNAGTDGLDMLSDLGFLRIEEAGALIHPVLAQYARALPEAQEILPALAETLAQFASTTEKQMKQTGTPSYFAPLLPHVQSVIEKVEGQRLQSMETMGTLWNSLGSYQDLTKNHAQARESFERALTIWKAIHGEFSSQTALAHSNLGGALRGLGDFEGALESFERALAIDEGIYGPDHPAVAKDLNNLGDALKALDDFKGAWSAYVCALAILKYVLGEDHPDVATQHNKVGIALRGQRDLQGAQESFERALSILLNVFPPGHPQVRSVRENIKSLDSLKDLAPLPQFTMHPIHTAGPERYFVCPRCGTVRGEALDADDVLVETKYYALDSETLPPDIAEAAQEALEQLTSKQSGREAIERIRASSRAWKATSDKNSDR